MSQPRLFLFDDRVGRWWAPLTLTRPAGELLFGCMTLRQRAERVLGTPCAGHLSRAALAGFDEPDAAPVLDPEEVAADTGDTRIFLDSRVVLDFQQVPELPAPARLVVEDRVAGWVVASGEPPPDEALRLDPTRHRGEGATVTLEGSWLERPWHLMGANPTRVRDDIQHLWLDDHRPDGVHRLGDAELSMAADAEIEEGVVVDTRDGPVRLDEGVRVEAPARLVGPLHVGRSSTVLGGWVGRSSIGPVCKVRGEVVDCVLLGFSNKAHDGYLGHSVLGRWVNLGAFTTNSDLKNNYGTVRVWTLEGEVDTGLMKVGCFLGDHVKTGIGTLLNTGTVVGAGSNVFGGIMPPSVVPPFSWGSGSDLRDHRLEPFLATAERAMERRGRALTSGVRALLRRAWEETAGRRAEG